MTGLNGADSSPEALVPADPAARARRLDLVHLDRQTDGDKALQSELLRLFQGQAREIDARIAAGEPAPPLAHRLKGAARAVGAWTVAAAADRLEDGTGTAAVLRTAVADTLPAVADHLAAQPGYGTPRGASI